MTESTGTRIKRIASTYLAMIFSHEGVAPLETVDDPEAEDHAKLPGDDDDNIPRLVNERPEVTSQS